MNTRNFPSRAAMKSILPALCLVLTVAPLVAGPAKPSTVGFPTTVALAATYQSGDSVLPLRQLEDLIRQLQTRPALRRQVEDALIKLLMPPATIEARRFACAQLAALGSERALPAIAELLQSPDTVTFACLALTSYPHGKADQFLRDALPASRAMARVQIIATLGDRRDTKAVSAIAATVREKEFAPMRAGITALGKIGTPAARQALAELRQVVSPELERWFTEADLRIAEQLAASGNRKAAAKIYESCLAPAQPAAVRRGAFAALARIEKDGGEPRILATLRGSDETLRPVAIGLVRSLPSKSASEKFAGQLPGLAPHEQVWLLDSLAARGDKAARATLTASLGSAHANVRRAAAAALSRIGDASSVRPFADAIAAAADADEARALESALGALPRRSETDQAILAEIKAARGETRARLIAALATRPSPEVTTALFAEVENPDPIVARAAYRVLARAGAGETLPQLVQKFAAIRNADLRSDVAGFVEQAVAATEPASLRTTAVRGALDRTREVESRCALLALLPACGSDDALATLNEAVQQADARIRETALRALAEWPTMAAWNPLAEVWRQTDNPAQRSTTLRGLVRLADESNAKPEAALIERYRTLLTGARNDDERKLILGALGGAGHPDALALALPLLDNTAVRAEAEAAVKKIAKAIEKQHPEAAKAALERLAK